MIDLLCRHRADTLDGLFRQHHVVVWHDDSGMLGPLLREGLPRGGEMPAFEGNPLSVRSLADTDDPWLERKWLLCRPAGCLPWAATGTTAVRASSASRWNWSRDPGGQRFWDYGPRRSPAR